MPLLGSLARPRYKRLRGIWTEDIPATSAIVCAIPPPPPFQLAPNLHRHPAPLNEPSPTGLVPLLSLPPPSLFPSKSGSTSRRVDVLQPSFTLDVEVSLSIHKRKGGTHTAAAPPLSSPRDAPEGPREPFEQSALLMSEPTRLWGPDAPGCRRRPCVVLLGTRTKNASPSEHPAAIRPTMGGGVLFVSYLGSRRGADAKRGGGCYPYHMCPGAEGSGPGAAV